MVLSFDRPGRLEGRSERMLGILRHLNRKHEDVLARCYKHPGVLEQNLKTVRRRKLGIQIYVSLIIAWAFLQIILDIDRESLWSWGERSENVMWFLAVWGIIQMRFEQNRIQSLRLIQDLRSEK
jgi:hypothetical protein